MQALTEADGGAFASSPPPLSPQPDAAEYDLFLNRVRLLSLVQRVAHSDVMELVDTVGLDALTLRTTGAAAARMTRGSRGGADRSGNIGRHRRPLVGLTFGGIDDDNSSDGALHGTRDRYRRDGWRGSSPLMSARRANRQVSSPHNGYQPRRTNQDLRAAAAADAFRESGGDKSYYGGNSDMTDRSRLRERQQQQHQRQRRRRGGYRFRSPLAREAYYAQLAQPRRRLMARDEDEDEASDGARDSGGRYSAVGERSFEAAYTYNQSGRGDGKGGRATICLNSEHSPSSRPLSSALSAARGGASQWGEHPPLPSRRTDGYIDYRGDGAYEGRPLAADMYRMSPASTWPPPPHAGMSGSHYPPYTQAQFGMMSSGGGDHGRDLRARVTAAGSRWNNNDDYAAASPPSTVENTAGRRDWRQGLSEGEQLQQHQQEEAADKHATTRRASLLPSHQYGNHRQHEQHMYTEAAMSTPAAVPTGPDMTATLATHRSPLSHSGPRQCEEGHNDDARGDNLMSLSSTDGAKLEVERAAASTRHANGAAQPSHLPPGTDPISAMLQAPFNGPHIPPLTVPRHAAPPSSDLNGSTPISARTGGANAGGGTATGGTENVNSTSFPSRSFASASGAGTPRALGNSRGVFAPKPKPKGALDSPRVPVDIIRHAAGVLSRNSPSQPLPTSPSTGPEPLRRANTEGSGSQAWHAAVSQDAGGGGGGILVGGGGGAPTTPRAANGNASRPRSVVFASTAPDMRDGWYAAAAVGSGASDTSYPYDHTNSHANHVNANSGREAGGCVGGKDGAPSQASGVNPVSAGSLRAIADSIDAMLRDHQRVLEEVVRYPSVTEKGRKAKRDSHHLHHWDRDRGLEPQQQRKDHVHDSAMPSSHSSQSPSSSSVANGTNTTSSSSADRVETEIDEMQTFAALQRKVNAMDQDMARIQARSGGHTNTICRTRQQTGNDGDDGSYDGSDAYVDKDDIEDVDALSFVDSDKSGGGPRYPATSHAASATTATTTKKAPRRLRGSVPEAVVRRMLSYQASQNEFIAFHEKLWNTSSVSQYTFAQRLTNALLEDCLTEVTNEVGGIMEEYVDGLADHELQ